MKPFDITITDQMREVDYRLKGIYSKCENCLIFYIDHKQSSFCGFGGSIDNPMPKIGADLIEYVFYNEIEQAIKEMEEREAGNA